MIYITLQELTLPLYRREVKGSKKDTEGNKPEYGNGRQTNKLVVVYNYYSANRIFMQCHALCTKIIACYNSEQKKRVE